MRLEEGMQQQLRHWRATLGSGAHRIGWKIGFNAPELQERLGIERPAVGHITSATLIGADGSHSLTGAERPLAEPEIAIEVGPEQSIAGLAAAVEVIDMEDPLDDPERAGEIVAGNIFHRAVAIGRSMAPDSADGIAARLSVNGGEVERACAPTAHLRATVDLVGETLADAGERLEAGDRIIAGSLTAPVPVEVGDRVGVDLGPLGQLQVAFTT
jgi:2-keto-4-pentenoate hydratase